MDEDDLEPAVSCSECGAESTVFYAVTDLLSFEREEYGRCDEHAPRVTIEEFINGGTQPAKR